jgi:hypothetical protein
MTTPAACAAGYVAMTRQNTRQADAPTHNTEGIQSWDNVSESTSQKQSNTCGRALKGMQQTKAHVCELFPWPLPLPESNTYNKLKAVF